MFDIGQKVVCVDDEFPQGINDIMNALPIKGRIYTVRDVVPGINFDHTGNVAVYIEELVNLPNRHGIEPGFAPHRFADPEEINEHEEVHEFASI